MDTKQYLIFLILATGTTFGIVKGAIVIKPSECMNTNVTCFGVRHPSPQGQVSTSSEYMGCLKDELEVERVYKFVNSATVKQAGIRPCDFLIMARNVGGFIEWDFRYNKSFAPSYNVSYSPNPQKTSDVGYWVNFEKMINGMTVLTTFYVVKYNTTWYQTHAVTKESSYLIHKEHQEDNPFQHTYFTSSTSLFLVLDGTNTELAYTDLERNDLHHKLRFYSADGNFTTSRATAFLGPKSNDSEIQTPESGSHRPGTSSTEPPRSPADPTKDPPTGSTKDPPIGPTRGVTGADSRPGGANGKPDGANGKPDGANGEHGGTNGSGDEESEADKKIKIALIVFAVLLLIVLIIDLILCCVLCSQNNKGSGEPIRE